MVPVHSIEVNRILVFVVLLAIVGRDQIYEVVGILLESKNFGFSPIHSLLHPFATLEKRSHRYTFGRQGMACSLVDH